MTRNVDRRRSGWKTPRVPAQKQIPITPQVLRWAIDESGYSDEQVAEKVGVAVDRLDAWLAGAAKPGKTHFKKLAEVLKRPPLTLLLPAPPAAEPAKLELRSNPAAASRELKPKERVKVREAVRLQRGVRWAAELLGEHEVELPKVNAMQANAEVVAAQIRAMLGVTVAEQREAATDSAMFKIWRRALEDLGIVVVALSLGPECSRGFSAWDGLAPLIAVNTQWNIAARIFTLFHEVGHLVSRTNSVCDEHVSRTASDPIERWCEQFAASLMMPRPEVEALLEERGIHGQVTDMKVAVAIKNRFNVSLRAAVLRLVLQGVAGWALYRSLPPHADEKQGGGGGGRDRVKIRCDEYGRRPGLLFLRALDDKVIDHGDATSFLKLHETELDDYRAALLEEAS
jgi:Zn-dependent peptidase ImmA (M78 family)